MFIFPSNFLFVSSCSLSSHTFGGQWQTLLQVSVTFSQAVSFRSYRTGVGVRVKEVKNKKLKIHNRKWDFPKQEWGHRLSLHTRGFKASQQGMNMPNRVRLGARMQTASKIHMTSALIPTGDSWTQPGPASYLILAAVWLPAAWLEGPTRPVQGRYQTWQRCKGGEDEMQKKMEQRTLTHFFWGLLTGAFVKSHAWEVWPYLLQE